MKIHDLFGTPFLKALLSFCIIAFGQPARIVWLCPIAACLGFTLFFSSLSPSSSRKERFWISTAWFAAVQMIQLSWMTSIEYQGYYILFVYLVLCCAIGAQFGLLASFLPQGNFRILHVFSLSAFWTIIEWSRVHISCGFSWNPVGLCLSFHEIPLQWASLFGIFGMSFWVMLINLLALKIWQSPKKRSLQLYGLALMALLPYFFGILHLSYHTKRMQRSEKTICAALVQTGLLPTEKVFHSHCPEQFIPSDRQWERILMFVKEKRDPVNPWDLIILPEAVVPKSAEVPLQSFEWAHQIFLKLYGPDVKSYFPQMAPPFAEKRLHLGIERTYISHLFWAQTIANQYDCDVVLGLDHFEPESHQFYNSAFLVSSRQQPAQRYDKRVLLPLAEYLPFECFRPLTKSYGIYEFFTQGKDPHPLKGKLKMGVSICYEETFSNVIRKHVQDDCDLLINLTNDNYYPYSLLSEQHFSHARLRTVENGCALLRSCNTGVTSAIDSLGRIVGRFGEKREEFKRGVLQCSLVPYRYQTLFSIWGDAGIVAISFGILGFFVFKILFYGRKEKN